MAEDDDDPIYKCDGMHTVGWMLKRILAIAAGVFVGAVLSVGAARLASLWGWLPNRELDRSSSYLREVLELVNDNYVDGKAAELPALTKSALHGIVESLDPHSEFLESRDFRQLEEDMANEFGGIGVQVEMRRGRVVVISPIAGSPGEKAGVRRGDEIVEIDGERTDKSSMDDVISKLRGKPKTAVAVGFFRPSGKNEFKVTLVREIIRMESVRDVRLLPGGIGYVQLTQFSERTGEEFINALNTLNERGMTSLILDLRNNPGGLLDAAVQVAEPFFSKGELIVYTQGRRPKDREEYRAEAAEPPLQLPMVVLVNAGSASAAEIVSGALKDTHRAVIVGERSFGKGSVQSIFNLKNGEGMRLTTARYYTPSGVTIHEKGVAPDVEVVMTPEDDHKIELQRAREDITSAEEFKERFGFEPIADRQLQAAVDVLIGIQSYTTKVPLTTSGGR